MFKPMRLPPVSLVLVITVAAMTACGPSGTEPVESTEPEAALAPQPPAPERSIAGLSGDRLPDPDTMVARVNGAEIQAREIFELAHMNRRRLLASGQPLDEDAERELLRLSLDLLIDNELLAEDARSKGIRVDPETLATALQKFRDEAGTGDALDRTLSEMGVTEEEFREELGRNLLVQQYTAELAGEAATTEEEALVYYRDNPEMFQVGEQTRVQQILVRSSSQDPEEKRKSNRARIDEAHERAMKGEDFGELAKEFSQTTNAAKGGDVGFFPRGVMVPAFEEMAFELPVGEISPVFETPYGFNIIKVTERREPRPTPFEEVKVSLMLELNRQRGAESVSKYVAGLRDKAKIEILTPELFEAPEPEAVKGAPAAGPVS